MKQLTFILSLIATTLFSGCNYQTIDSKQTVNPIIGDISFVNKFGYQPDAATDNELRIKTHLEYVENMLRQKDVSALPVELQNKRNHLLNLLHNYWTAGVFPKNHDYPGQRKPCFIDKDNTICAVGYLVEQSTGRQVANDINNKHQYEELLAMNDNTVDNWISTSGLKKEECAMIQPSYGPTPGYGPRPGYTYNHITPAAGISSSILGGISLSLNTVNGIQIAKGANSKAIPIAGLFTGLSQITLGAAMFPKEKNGWNGNYTNESQKVLSMVNIGLGTTTIILSAWNLFTNRKPKDKLTSWNIYSFPTQNNNTGLAFSLTRKF